MPYQEKSAPDAFFKDKNIDERLLTTKQKEEEKPAQAAPVEKPTEQTPQINIPFDQVGDPFSNQLDPVAPKMDIP